MGVVGCFEVGFDVVVLFVSGSGFDCVGIDVGVVAEVVVDVEGQGDDFGVGDCVGFDVEGADFVYGDPFSVLCDLD